VKVLCVVQVQGQTKWLVGQREKEAIWRELWCCFICSVSFTQTSSHQEQRQHCCYFPDIYV